MFKNAFEISRDIYSYDSWGEIKGINVIEAKQELERGFSEEYREIYIQLHLAISDLVWFIRQQSIPIDRNKKQKKS